jgi:outer membrane immunogenic protein
MMKRFSYLESCLQLQALSLLDGGQPPRLRDRMPRYDDGEPWGVSFFRTKVTDDSLANLTLPRTYFGRSEISRVSFRNTDFTESSLCWNDFVDVDFSATTLAQCDLRSSQFDRVKFIGADLRVADMRRSSFNACIFDDAISVLAGVLVAITSLAAAMPASAADLPAKAPVLRAPPAAVNWTGFYVGANAGYAWGKTDVRASATPAFGPEFQDYFNSNGTFGLKPKGFVGGAQAGFNYQTGVWVYGLKADVQSFNATASRDTGIIAAPVGQTGGFQDKFDTSWLVTIRPRLGVTIDRALIYATGGMAIAELKLSQQSSICSGGLCLAHLDGAASSTKVGWVVGGGVEHALTGNWSVKAEYLYVDFGTMGLRRFFVDITGVHPEFFIDNTANLRAHIARFGVNYKFYSDGPIIAKY